MSRHDQLYSPFKLRPLKSPILDSAGDGCGDGCGDDGPGSPPVDRGGEAKDGLGDGLPRFRRYHEPTLLELFFDLFFAANYDVFSDTQQMALGGSDRFEAYIGYFCLLWLTWFSVTLFDVRFVTDCIFSRVTRAIQLGVLVGFAIVAPKFNLTNQHSATMQTMSLILMVSRLCLAVEYGTTLWHARRFQAAHRPLYAQIAVHFLAAVVYFAVYFRFPKDQNSCAYLAWYLVSGAEAGLSLAISNLSPVLSLTETHLMKRMTLLTVMIMGDGIVEVAKHVVTIVKNPNPWNAVTIEMVTAASVTFYFVFLVYFDWLRSSFYLPSWRQQAWTVVHLPFNLALVIFTQGFTQLIIWSKVMDASSRIFSGKFDMLPLNATSREYAASYRAMVMSFFECYPPKIESSWDTVGKALANISDLPDWVWPAMMASGEGAGGNDSLPGLQEHEDRLFYSFTTLAVTQSNALFATYGIDTGDVEDAGGVSVQARATDMAAERYGRVFMHTYIATGCTLFLMAVLSVIVRSPSRRPWPRIRLLIVALLALCTGLVALFYMRWKVDQPLLSTPWVLPIIALVWTVVLIVTHINGEGLRRNAHILGRFRSPRAGVGGAGAAAAATKSAAGGADGGRSKTWDTTSTAVPD